MTSFRGRILAGLLTALIFSARAQTSLGEVAPPFASYTYMSNIACTGANCANATFQTRTVQFDRIPNQIFGGSPFLIAAQASPQQPISFASISPAVCKVAADLVTLSNVGTCTIMASPKGIVGSAPLGTQNFTVAQAKASAGFSASPGSPYAVSTNPYFGTVGDFNGDGIPDMAIVDNGSNALTLLLGDGTGAFKPAPGSPLSAGPSPAQAIVAADFNGDGLQDLAVANYDASLITILVANGTRGFTETTVKPCPAGTSPISLAVGDLNGDGTQDLTTACDGSNNIAILANDGTGNFSPIPGSPITSDSTPQALALGDFNGDGILDIAATNPARGSVTIFLGNTSGSFTAAQGGPINVGSTPRSIVVGDFNRDGIPDLAVANRSSNNVSILLGNGTGGFAPAPGGLTL
jgi:hypothetical protein